MNNFKFDVECRICIFWNITNKAFFYKHIQSSAIHFFQDFYMIFVHNMCYIIFVNHICTLYLYNYNCSIRVYILMPFNRRTFNSFQCLHVTLIRGIKLTRRRKIIDTSRAWNVKESILYKIITNYYTIKLLYISSSMGVFLR